VTRVYRVAALPLALALVGGTPPLRAHEAHGAPVIARAAGLAVAAPAGWRRIGEQDGRLLFLSPGPGEQGVVIARGQAMILVAPVAGWRRGGDLRAAIRAEQGDDRVIARRTLRFPAGGGTCREVEEVDTATEVGPGVEQVNAAFYCVIGDRAALVQLTHWPRDAGRARFRAAALKVVRSLRPEG